MIHKILSVLMIVFLSVLLISSVSKPGLAQKQTFPGSGVGAVPSTAYTFSVSGGTVTATPNAPSLPTYSSTDFCVAWNDVTTQLATVGGHIFIKNPLAGQSYNCNSLTTESTGTCANISFALGFPANTSLATSVQWIVEGEAMPVWTGESGSTAINNSGTIIHVTSTATASVASGVLIEGFWPRPVTNCGLAASNASNEIHIKNLAIRYPTNQRGNEAGICLWFAQAVEIDNATADFDLAYNAIATGSAPVAGTQGSFGMCSSVASSSNYQRFNNTFVTGWDQAYDLYEHINGGTMTAIYNNHAGEFGRAGTTVFHPGIIEHFVDQENAQGITFGPSMSSNGPEVNMYYDIEASISAAWYNRTANFTDSAKVTRGTIWFTEVQQGVGILSNPIITPNGSLITTIERGRVSPGAFVVLPTCSAAIEGMHRVVTDSNIATFGSTIAGGGTNHVPAYCNGTNWVVD